MSRVRSTILVFCLVMGLFVAVAPQGYAADEFYKSKNVTVLVGSSPGGGFDANARAIARHIGKYLPGHPSVIVRNMPGAGSLMALRYLDVTAPKDGTVMAVFNPGILTQSIVTPDKVNLDFRKFAWIGVVTPDYRVCYGYGSNGATSWTDLMRRTEEHPFIMGATAKDAGNYINGATLREVFGAHVKQILGFPGSAEQRLAIERGELDGDCGSWSSIPADWLKRGKVHAFVRFTESRPSEIPESAVYIGTFAKTETQKGLLSVLDAAGDVGRPLIVSKKVPADRVATIRKAFNDTMEDKAFLAEMEKQKLPVNPESGEEAEQIVGKMMNVPPSVIAQAKKIYE